MLKSLFFVALIAWSKFFLGQTDSLTSFQIWGDIHFFSYYETLHNTKPWVAFGVSTGIIGIRKTIQQAHWKVTGTIMYDVKKTTRLTFSDSSGITSYTEGSHYTSFLKMGEIQLSPLHGSWHFSVGQLLSDQYLTVQDKAWGKRYIMTTLQEYYRLGLPADFGVRFGYTTSNKKWYGSFSLLNGDGPFREQDTNSTILTSIMVTFHDDFKQKHHILGKIYLDYQPIKTSHENKIALNAFAQYENPIFKLGIDFAHIVQTNDLRLSPSTQMISNYIIWRTIFPNLSMIVRNDLFIKHVHTTLQIQYMVGLEWEPLSTFGITLSFRRNTLLNQSFIYIHTGFKF